LSLVVAVATVQTGLVEKADHSALGASLGAPETLQHSVGTHVHIGSFQSQDSDAGVAQIKGPLGTFTVRRELPSWLAGETVICRVRTSETLRLTLETFIVIEEVPLVAV
jgi:hypothetical protein